MKKLISRNPVLRFKEGLKIEFLLKGGVKRFSVSPTMGGETKYFDTEEEAKAYLRTQRPGTTIRRDGANSWKGSVLKSDRSKEKSTEYARLLVEAPYNKLSFKDAYALARKNNVRWFGYKGKVYKSDLQGAKNNLTELEGIYGNNLGWGKDPKFGNKLSQRARTNYRKEIDAKLGNRNANYKGVTNKLANLKADLLVAKTWDEVKFVDALMPMGGVMNLAMTAMDKDYKPEIYRSGLNPLGYALDILEGNVGGTATRALDTFGHFGFPGASTLVTKMAPKIPLSTYLPKFYHGDAGSTNWVINGLNRASGKAKNLISRLVPRKGNGLYGKYSIEGAEHISPKATAVVTNKVNQYVTSNPNAVLPLYTYFGNAFTNPATWTTADWVNQYANNNYK